MEEIEDSDSPSTPLPQETKRRTRKRTRSSTKSDRDGDTHTLEPAARRPQLHTSPAHSPNDSHLTLRSSQDVSFQDDGDQQSTMHSTSGEQYSRSHSYRKLSSLYNLDNSIGRALEHDLEAHKMDAVDNSSLKQASCDMSRSLLKTASNPDSGPVLYPDSEPVAEEEALELPSEYMDNNWQWVGGAFDEYIQRPSM
jgi:hypothetical protein